MPAICSSCKLHVAHHLVEVLADILKTNNFKNTRIYFDLPIAYLTVKIQVLSSSVLVFLVSMLEVCHKNPILVKLEGLYLTVQFQRLSYSISMLFLLGKTIKWTVYLPCSENPDAFV